MAECFLEAVRRLQAALVMHQQSQGGDAPLRLALSSGQRGRQSPLLRLSGAADGEGAVQAGGEAVHHEALGGEGGGRRREPPLRLGHGSSQRSSRVSRSLLQLSAELRHVGLGGGGGGGGAGRLRAGGGELLREVLRERGEKGAEGGREVGSPPKLSEPPPPPSAARSACCSARAVPPTSWTSR